jgi:hypothetical protein
MAQLIPVLLIALFVLDGGRFIKLTKKRARALSKADQRGERSLSNTPKLKRKLERTLARVDSDIASLRNAEPSQASDDERLAIENMFSELAEMRAEVIVSSEKLVRLSEDLNHNLARAHGLRRELKTAAQNLVKAYVYYVVFLIFLSVAGELVVLWGAIGLINSLVAIGWGTDLTVIIVGSLSALSAERLMPDPTSKFSRNLQALWVFATFGAAQATFIWILASVKVTH